MRWILHLAWSQSKVVFFLSSCTYMICSPDEIIGFYSQLVSFVTSTWTHEWLCIHESVFCALMIVIAFEFSSVKFGHRSVLFVRMLQVSAFEWTRYLVCSVLLWINLFSIFVFFLFAFKTGLCRWVWILTGTDHICRQSSRLNCRM